eukprot:g3085.t1
MLDIVLWGATGFTGGFVARELCKATAAHGLRWGIAGRNAEKLRALAESLDGDNEPQLIEAQVDDEVALRGMVQNASVLVSTAGPFSEIGMPALRACISEGVHYIDTNGEIPWHRRMIAECSEEAERRQVALIPSCGFDSVPSEIGAKMAAKALWEEHNVAAERIDAYFHMRGSLSGGTVASGICSEALADDSANSPFALVGGGRPQPDVRGKVISQRADEDPPMEPIFDDWLQQWTMPFIMGHINSRVVRRGIAVAADPGLQKRPVYTERAIAPGGRRHAAKLCKLLRLPSSRRKQMVAEGLLPKPGQGPAKEVREKSYFHALFRASSGSVDAVVHLGSAMDPGYELTGRLCSDAAVRVALNPERFARQAGVLTPGTAFTPEELSQAFDVASIVPSTKVSLETLTRPPQT